MFFIQGSQMLGNPRTPYLFIVLEIQSYFTSILSQIEFLRITVICFFLIEFLFIAGLQCSISFTFSHQHVTVFI